MSTIINYFPDVHLGNSHQGLAELSQKAKLPIDQLRPGQFNLFINRAQTALKMLAPGGLIIYYRHPENHRINLDTLQFLPKYIQGARLNYNAALKETLTRDFAKRGRIK